MERIDLFSCSLYKTKLDPASYDKKHLFNIIENNYNISPKRVSPDGTYPKTVFHTYHSNWDNPLFSELPLHILTPVYDKIIKEFISDLGIGQFEYEWNITNINAGKDGFMERHSHLVTDYKRDEFPFIYVMTHYLSFDRNNHPLTRFANYSHFIYNEKVRKWGNNPNIDSKDPKNSLYFPMFAVDVDEDDVVIFPGFLEHDVIPNYKEDIDKLRIVIALNIHMKPVGETKW